MLLSTTLEFSFFLIPILLYFYNIINSTGSSSKNIAIRTMLIGLNPVMYRFTKEGMTSVLLLSALPILVFCLLCAITKTHILSSRYFRHLCLIYLYCFIGFIIYFVSQNTESHLSRNFRLYASCAFVYLFGLGFLPTS